MGIKVFDSPQVFDEAIIIEFNLEDLKPTITTKFFYNGKEISFSQYYLLLVRVNSEIAKKVGELQIKEFGKDTGFYMTGMHIFKYKTNGGIKILEQANIWDYNYVPEIKRDGNKIIVILHRQITYSNKWEFKSKAIDKEIEQGLTQFIQDFDTLTRLLALTK